MHGSQWKELVIGHLEGKDQGLRTTWSLTLAATFLDLLLFLGRDFSTVSMGYQIEIVEWALRVPLLETVT